MWFLDDMNIKGDLWANNIINMFLIDMWTECMYC